MFFSGRNCLIEALKSDLQRVKRVFLSNSDNNDQKVNLIVRICHEENIPLEFTSRKAIERMVGSEDTQGICFECYFKTFRLNDELKFNHTESQSYIYIYTATYEHNVGAITRSAETAGFSGVILPKSIEITNTVARTSAGSIFNIKIFRESIFETIKKFKEIDYKIFSIERGGDYYFNVDLTVNGLFIIGGEDKSIGDNLKSKSDYILEIPQKGKVNSLNMSVAASIVMFESLKQKIK